MQQGLSCICDWSSSQKLCFNFAKCNLLHFYTSDGIVNFNCIMDGTSLLTVDSYNDLGVVISNNLSKGRHHSVMVAKAYQQLGLIKRLFNRTSTVEVRKERYLILIRSQLTYCSQVWRPQLVQDIVTFERVQRRATWYILSHSRLEYRERLLELTILP